MIFKTFAKIYNNLFSDYLIEVFADIYFIFKKKIILSNSEYSEFTYPEK